MRADAGKLSSSIRNSGGSSGATNGGAARHGKHYQKSDAAASAGGETKTAVAIKRFIRQSHPCNR